MITAETPETRQEIEVLAYAIWESEGRPEGRALDHWLEALRRFETGGAKPPAGGKRSTMRRKAADQDDGAAPARTAARARTVKAKSAKDKTAKDKTAKAKTASPAGKRPKSPSAASLSGLSADRSVTRSSGRATDSQSGSGSASRRAPRGSKTSS